MKKDGFKIIGISIRTTNKNNQAQQDLGSLWEQFYAEKYFEKIPNKLSNEVVAIYTDYKNDFKEDYTTIIAMMVSTLENIPPGLIGREFPPENFIEFTAKGELPNSVGSTWVDIWKKDKELNRKYSYDFELYGEKSQNGKESEVSIFIAIK